MFSTKYQKFLREQGVIAWNLTYISGCYNLLLRIEAMGGLHTLTLAGSTISKMIESAKDGSQRLEEEADRFYLFAEKVRETRTELGCNRLSGIPTALLVGNLLNDLPPIPETPVANVTSIRGQRNITWSFKLDGWLIEAGGFRFQGYLMDGLDKLIDAASDEKMRLLAVAKVLRKIAEVAPNLTQGSNVLIGYAKERGIDIGFRVYDNNHWVHPFTNCPNHRTREGWSWRSLEPQENTGAALETLLDVVVSYINS